MLVFDFDGVLVDSMREVVVTSYRVVSNALPTRIEEIPENYRLRFLSHRHLARSGGEIVTLAKWCLEVCDTPYSTPLSLADFQQRLNQETESIENRSAVFFKTRREFAAQNPNAWAELNSPFEQVWNALSQHHPKDILVVTNKNKHAVIHISRHFGFEFLSENIFAADEGKTKTEHFVDLSVKFPNTAFVFIDDNLLNLKELRKALFDCGIPFHPLLADWGYASHEDKSEQAREDIPLVSISECTRLLSANPRTIGSVEHV